MNILYDKAMPYAKEFFSSVGNAKAFEAGELKADILRNIDVLLVRSTTSVDENILSAAPNLRFVGTATAGFNHFDLASISERNIPWAAAAGCNARAVAEYVLAALLSMANRHDFQLKNKSVAIVGVGQVGHRVSTLCKCLGMRVIEYDPPKALLDSGFSSCSFDEVLEADIISLHTPLSKTGAFPSEHLFSQKVFDQLNNNQILINASRGEVIDSQNIEWSNDNLPRLVFDCWEFEPEIDRTLIPYCDIATAHIAGHSLEGKARGTSMLYDIVCELFRLPNKLKLSDFLPTIVKSERLLALEAKLNVHALNQSLLQNLVSCFYDIENDDSFFRRHMAEFPSIKEIRRTYPIRREFDAVPLDIAHEKNKIQLRHLGFNILSDSN